MPNRIIKESIRTSRSVNGLTDFQFRLWVYLITYVDDFGRGSADPELLKGFVFPRRKSVTESSIAKGLTDLAAAGLIHLYTVDGDSYLCFPTWTEHQRIQNKKSKFPAPETELSPSLTVTHGDSPSSTVTHGDSPPESESEYESEYEGSCTEQSGSASVPAVIALPTNTGDEFPVTAEHVSEWAGLYPAVDVMQELRKMRGWLLSNPKKRKTAGGMLRFVNGWLAKEQNRGGAAEKIPQRPEWRGFDE